MELEEQERLIERMRETVQRAKTNYQRAKEEFNQASQSDLHNSDGRYTMSQATMRERLAFDEFRRALYDYNRLILDGKLPPPRRPPE